MALLYCSIIYASRKLPPSPVVEAQGDYRHPYCPTSTSMGTLSLVKCLVTWQILSFVLSLWLYPSLWFRHYGSVTMALSVIMPKCSNWWWHVLSSRVVSCVFLLFAVQLSHCLDSSMTDNIVLLFYSSSLERWTSLNFLNLREASSSSQLLHTVRLWLSVITDW